MTAGGRRPDPGTLSAPDAGAPPRTQRVGWGFILLYALAYLSTCLLFLAPVLVTLALKINSLVGIEQAPNSLALVAGVGALLAMFANPFFGMLSDRSTSRFGMRRTWTVVGLGAGSGGILVVALAPNVAMVLVGWCIAQVFFNALLAAVVAVLADQVRQLSGAWSPACSVSACLSRRSEGPLWSTCSRQPARDVPRPVCSRRLLRPALRRHLEGPPEGWRSPAALVRS